MKKFAVIVLITTQFMLACSTSDSDSKGNKVGRLNWAAVPSKFNPSTEDIQFKTAGIEKIHLNISNFDRDVEVIYAADLPANSGVLRLYKVWAKQYMWPNLSPQSDGKTLALKSYGSYSCSIDAKNGSITALEGGCYVRMQIFLPLGSEIEVYNVDQLITRRFIPMDNETFLHDLDRATWADEKFFVIDTFLNSHRGTAKRPALMTQELSEVLGEFIRGEEKLKALRQLHAHVIDREKLGGMIQNSFSYFDREEALRIVGL